MVKKAITDGEKKMNKKIKDQINFKHGYAIVDGHIEKVRGCVRSEATN